jgi:uncharacterized protein YacL (UPF0231 family)
MENATKNLTVKLSLEEHDLLESLIEYFQEQSISSVSKSDVVKYLIRRFYFIMTHREDETIKELESRIRELTI